MLLQMALFDSFLWLNNIPLYVCTTSSLAIYYEKYMSFLNPPAMLQGKNYLYFIDEEAEVQRSELTGNTGQNHN